MAPKDMPWFRFYSEARRDPKIRKAAQAVGVNFLEALGFWAALLTLAGESPERGKLLVTLLERFTLDDIAFECNTDVQTAQKFLEAFQKYDMVQVLPDGTIVIKNWEKRQFSSDSSTERVRALREKRRCNSSETFPSASASSSDSGSNGVDDSSLNPPPDQPPAYSDDPALEDIYRRVTNQMTIPATKRDDTLSALRVVLREKGNSQAAIDYLHPFWLEWTEPKRGYSRSNTAWLTDWAVSGQVPPPKGSNGGKPKTLAQAFEEA